MILVFKRSFKNGATFNIQQNLGTNKFSTKIYSSSKPLSKLKEFVWHYIFVLIVFQILVMKIKNVLIVMKFLHLESRKSRGQVNVIVSNLLLYFHQRRPHAKKTKNRDSRYYHVINRGVEQRVIFKEDEDYKNLTRSHVARGNAYKTTTTKNFQPPKDH